MPRQKTKIEEKYPECMRCNNKVPNLIRINSNQITGKASWHREMPEVIHVCNECAKELSDALDKCWLLKGKSKFTIRS